MNRYVLLDVASLKECPKCGKTVTKVVKLGDVCRPLYITDNNIGHYLQIDVVQGRCRNCNRFSWAKRKAHSIVEYLLLFSAGLGLIVAGVLTFTVGNLLVGISVLIISCLMVNLITRYFDGNNLNDSELLKKLALHGFEKHWDYGDFLRGSITDYGFTDLGQTFKEILTDDRYCLYDTQLEKCVNLSSQILPSVFACMENTVYFDD